MTDRAYDEQGLDRWLDDPRQDPPATFEYEDMPDTDPVRRFYTRLARRQAQALPGPVSVERQLDLEYQQDVADLGTRP